MKQLITADLHLTSNTSDDYRWDTFAKLDKMINNQNIQQLIILGDITEKKDGHSAQLVNRFVDELEMLKRHLDAIYILQGNHDFSVIGEGFWRFLNRMEDIRYIYHPGYYEDCKAYFLPYDNPIPAWSKHDPGDVLFMHDLVAGARYQTTMAKKGFSIKQLPARTISGHIHMPQDIFKRRGCLSYVGSPHSVDFGDHFKPRVLIRDIDTNEIWEEITGGAVKWACKIKNVSDLRQYDFSRGDFVKVSLETESQDIEELKNEVGEYLAAKKLIFSGFSIEKLEMAGLTRFINNQNNETVFEDYCKENALSQEYRDSAECIIASGGE